MQSRCVQILRYYSYARIVLLKELLLRRCSVATERLPEVEAGAETGVRRGVALALICVNPLFSEDGAGGGGEGILLSRAKTARIKTTVTPRSRRCVVRGS